MTAPEPSEFQFKAEVQRVLSLVVHSLYTSPEVFLRELVSNASDALDKARFVAASDKSAREQVGEPAIEITLDEANRTLVIEDNGIGMTRDEVIENLGTVARSGTTEFLQQYGELLKKKAEGDAAVELIGKFGVGFYAAFMVASRVDVETSSMSAGAEPVLWRSSGEGTFHVLPGERSAPGTRITLHLKEDATEFAERWRVEKIIQKYSDFVAFPIRIGGVQVNRGTAPWRLPKAKVTDEQHAELFHHLTGGRMGEKPLLTLHWAVDAPVQFNALLYVPLQRPFDLFQPDQKKQGPRLYAQRVLISESCESLVPGYLRFLRGVVDSEDLTLNVSRETLQENRTVKQIQQQLVKQVLKGLSDMAEGEPDKYLELWRLFGPVLKEGIAVDWKNKEAIAGLARFETMLAPQGTMRSLDEYLKLKPDEQKSIYYLTGANRQQLLASPHLEVFRKRAIDVLLLSDPIDEFVVQSLTEYQKLPLASAAHGEIDLGAAEEKPATDERLGPALVAIQAALGDLVKDVRASSRLTETASVLVSAEGTAGAHFERMMKMLDDRAVEQKRILEVNPTHPFVQNLAVLVARDPQSPRIGLWAEMLYDIALLGEGVVSDPAKLAKRLQDLLVESSGRVV